jgi:hypothetical protein
MYQTTNQSCARNRQTKVRTYGRLGWGVNGSTPQPAHQIEILHTLLEHCYDSERNENNPQLANFDSCARPVLSSRVLAITMAGCVYRLPPARRASSSASCVPTGTSSLSAGSGSIPDSPRIDDGRGVGIVQIGRVLLADSDGGQVWIKRLTRAHGVSLRGRLHKATRSTSGGHRPAPIVQLRSDRSGAEAPRRTELTRKGSLA